MTRSMPPCCPTWRPGANVFVRLHVGSFQQAVAIWSAFPTTWNASPKRPPTRRQLAHPCPSEYSRTRCPATQYLRASSLLHPARGYARSREPPPRLSPPAPASQVAVSYCQGMSFLMTPGASRRPGGWLPAQHSARPHLRAALPGQTAIARPWRGPAERAPRATWPPGH